MNDTPAEIRLIDLAQTTGKNRPDFRSQNIDPRQIAAGRSPFKCRMGIFQKAAAMPKKPVPLRHGPSRTGVEAAQGSSTRQRPFKTTTFLENHPLFRGLAREPLARIVETTLVIEAPHGSVLFKAGDPCRGFHIIVDGQIKLAVETPQGGEKVIELLGPGQSFGEAVMFLETPYRVTAEAIADTKLLHIDRTAVFAELDRDPQLARSMIAGLSMRLHHLVSDLESQALQSGTQRVMGYLLSLVDDTVRKHALIQLPARKNIIASRLNLTQEHFSRILHSLAAAGVIGVQGQKISIPDLAALRRHTG